MVTHSRQHNDALYNQIEDAYGKVVYTYTTQIIHATRLHKRNTVLKWCQLVLSAIATGGFIGTLISNQIILTWVGGLCSTALLVLTAYFKDVDISSLYKKHFDTSNRLWLLREQYLSLLIDFESLSKKEIINQRDALQMCASEIYNSAPMTDSKSYAKAQQALKENESQFFSKEELDKMLPQHLRKRAE